MPKSTAPLSLSVRFLAMLARVDDFNDAAEVHTVFAACQIALLMPRHRKNYTNDVGVEGSLTSGLRKGDRLHFGNTPLKS